MIIGDVQMMCSFYRIYAKKISFSTYFFNCYKSRFIIDELHLYLKIIYILFFICTYTGLRFIILNSDVTDVSNQ